MGDFEPQHSPNDFYISGGTDIMQEIELTRGKVALVDDADYPWVSNWKWYAADIQGRTYAVRGEWNPVRHVARVVYMHRLIMRAAKGQVVDHINHDGLDNRRENLRLCSQAENARNRRKAKGCSSRFLGVTFIGDRKQNDSWKAQIMANHETVFLGNFHSEEEAALAYNEAAQRLHGAFATLNVVEEASYET
jgi:hypothetical protein